MGNWQNKKQSTLEANCKGYAESGYIALLELRFDWTTEEVDAFESLWNEGYTLAYIAQFLKRDADEVACLVMDRRRKGKIKCRPRGVF